MVSRETVSVVFPRVLMFPEFVIYLDCHIAKKNQTNKQRRRVGNNCAIVSRSRDIRIWPGARDQESTNQSAHFVE